MRTEESVDSSDLDLMSGNSMAGIHRGTSFSGGERDALFVQDDDGHYVDVSLISGANHPGDGRMVVRADFDRDGFADMALTNSNAPFFRLFRNRVGRSSRTPGGFVALSLEGGNTSPGPAAGLSSRTPIGARVEYYLSGRKVVRELRAGEGMGAHNSAVLLLGLGSEPRADRARVYWPSGRISELGDLTAGRWLRFSETGGRLADEAYVVDRPSERKLHKIAPHPLFASQLASAGEERGTLNLFVFMGTWCSRCRASAGPLRTLLERARDLDVAAFGIAEHRGSADDIAAFLRETNAPYPIAELNPGEVEQVQALCEERWLQYAVPLYILTDSDGRVLDVQRKMPTLSQLRGSAASMGRHATGH